MLNIGIHYPCTHDVDESTSSLYPLLYLLATKKVKKYPYLLFFQSLLSLENTEMIKDVIFMKDNNNFNTDDDMEILEEAFDGNLDALYEDDFEYENTRKMRNRMRLRNTLIGSAFFLVVTVVIGLIMMGIYANGQKVLVTNSYIARREYFESVEKDYQTLNSFIIKAGDGYVGTFYTDIVNAKNQASQNTVYNTLTEKFTNIVDNQESYTKASKKYPVYYQFNNKFIECADNALAILDTLNQANFVIDAKNQNDFDDLFAGYCNSSSALAVYYNAMYQDLNGSNK